MRNSRNNWKVIVWVASAAFVAEAAVATGVAEAACPAPAANQAVVYTDPGFGGNCAVLVAGPWPLSDLIEAGIPDNSISSVIVGSGVRLVLYHDDPFSGPEADYESGAHVVSLGSVDEQTSSLRVQLDNGHRIAAVHLNDYPSDRDNYWNQYADRNLDFSFVAGVQGLAHGATDWFATNKTTLFKIPFSQDLSEDNVSPGNSVPIPPALVSAGYNHFGDPDVYGAFVFIPVESPNPGVYPAIAVFRTSDLSFVNWDIFFGANADSQGGFHSAWLSIDGSGNVYTSDANISGLTQYVLDQNGLCEGCGYVLQAPVNTRPLYDWYGNPEPALLTMQGGDLSPDGSLIYLTNSGGDNDDNRIRVFDVSTGILQAQSENDYGLFDYKWSSEQEAEGVDYFDTNGSITPNVTGQLHVLLFANISGSYWLKHYSL
jgi:hypothetical protein